LNQVLYEFNLKFQGLFRNFGDTFLPLLKPHLERLVADTLPESHESNHRCASEIVAGLIRGCKHWPFEKVVEDFTGFNENIL